MPRATHKFAFFALSIVVRIMAFLAVIMLVWISYVFLFAYHPDFLGWCYAKLRPLTITFYQLIDDRLPESVKYKVSAGLTDELGARALFLLLLGGLSEAVVLGAYWMLAGLIRYATSPLSGGPRKERQQHA
jgi:hypothetical protein